MLAFIGPFVCSYVTVMLDHFFVLSQSLTLSANIADKYNCSREQVSIRFGRLTSEIVFIHKSKCDDSYIDPLSIYQIMTCSYNIKILHKSMNVL